MSASSSSGAPPCKADAPKNVERKAPETAKGKETSETQQAEEREEQCSFAPHNGYLFVEKPYDSDAYFALHTKTLERVRLPVGADWYLEFDNDGFAVFVDPDDAKDPIVAIDLLSKHLIITESDPCVVQEAGEPGRRWSLTEKLREHQELKIDLQLGPNWTLVKMRACLLVWPNAEGKIVWSAIELYQILGLHSFGGQPSKWFYSAAARWGKYFRSLGFSDGHTLRSRINCAQRVGADEGLRRLLPFPALSSIGMVAQLCRWSTANPREGGLRDEAAPEAARWLLRSLLRAACSASELAPLELRFVPAWAHTWPFKQTVAPDVVLIVDKAGFVDLKPWRRLVDRLPPLASKWWAALVSSGGLERDADRVALSDFLCMSSGVAALKPLHSQMLYYGAMALEASAMESLEAGTVQGHPMTVQRVNFLDLLLDPQRLDHELLRYTMSVRDACAEETSFTFATDKANVGGMSLLNTIVGFGQGFAALAPPQVSKAFVASDGLSSSGGKKQLLAVNKRHIAWLKRIASKKGEKDAWRPRKTHRSAAVKIIGCLDNQLRTCTPRSLQYFQHDGRSSTWAPSSWRTWPMLTGTIDQGSDGLAACMAMERKMETNLQVYYDWSHGACRDLDGSYKKIGQYSMMLLFLVILNLPHGPDKDEGLRFAQLREALDHMFQTFAPANFALYQARAPEMLKELGDKVEVTDDNPEQALWQYLRSAAPFEKKQYRAKLCQFMSWIRRCYTLLSEWTTTRFKCEYVALEMDMLQGSEFKKEVVVKRSALESAAETTSTSTSTVQLDHKILKSACKNAVVVTIAVLERSEYRRRLAVMVLVPWPLSKWQGRAAKEMKSAGSNQRWLMNELEHNFMDHQVDILGQLASAAFMEECGFLDFAQAPENEKQCAAIVDDDLARMAGLLATTLIANRQRRLLYMTKGYPGSLAKLNLEGAAAQRVVDGFSKDYRNFQKFNQMEVLPPGLKPIMERSPFHIVAVRQYVEAFGELGYTAHKDIKQLAHKRTQGVLTTLPVEDIHNVQKNTGQKRGSQKYRRPQQSMAVAVAKATLHRRHEYQAVKCSAVIEQKALRLNPSAFGHGVIEPSCSLAGIATPQQKATYFSPAPENLALPTMDLFILRDLAENGVQGDIASNTFLGAFSSASNMVVFRRVSGRGEDLTWHFGLEHRPSSAILAWPVKLLPIQGERSKQIVEFTKAREPTVISILSWKGLKARECVWMSWASQVLQWPAGTKRMQPAVRLIAVGAEMKMEKVAATMGWWDLDLSTLRRLAGHLQLGINKDAGLMDTLYEMTEAVTHGTPEEVMAYLSKRLMNLSNMDHKSIKILSEVDEASKCLTKEDEEVLQRTQKQGKEPEADYDGFVEQWRARREKVRQDHLEKNAAKKRKTTAASSSTSGPRSLPANLEMLPQSEVKALLPPGRCSIWKSRRDSAWHTRYSDMPTTSRSVARHGERAALHQVVSQAWRHYCLLEGIPEGECPMGGLAAFEEQEGMP